MVRTSGWYNVVRGPQWSYLVEQPTVTEVKESSPLKHRWQRGNVVQENSDEAAQSRVERLESGEFAHRVLCWMVHPAFILCHQGCDR